ncbi:MAG: LCP family protein [Parcubacteria group bacterium]|jgi:LCP family protein required for cell wall assembly|nr:LCP family protein [Candidatus Moranbacteria bacterium]
MEFIKEGMITKKRVIIGGLVLIFIIVGLIFWKAGSVLNKISSEGGLLSSIAKSIPGIADELKGEDEGRINILLLGMRGENVPGGGLLSDTIMVVSINPELKRVSMVSIPRDLYVNVPGTESRQKINAVYFYGEEKERGKGGMGYMKQVVGDISGQPIHYAIAINFAGFEQLVDALGGIDIHLDQPFSEPLQFHEAHVCDGNNGGVFTVPTGEYQVKKNERGKIVAKYPLCYNKNEECGGNFTLPAGDVHLDGENALCYVRSRVTSNDFDRARRQQQVIQEIRNKALSLGTLASIGTINDILDSLGNNARTDLEGWEIKRLLDLYGEITAEGSNIDMRQKVLENTEEGLLYSPTDYPPEVGYILLPRGGNYDRIKEMFLQILN